MVAQVKPHIVRVEFDWGRLGWGVWENVTQYVKQYPPLMQCPTLQALKASYNGWPKANKEK